MCGQIELRRLLPMKPKIITAAERAKRAGLGDAVSIIATPIGRAIHHPCIDSKTGLLKVGSPCHRVKTFLNKVVPNVGLKTGSPPDSKPSN